MTPEEERLIESFEVQSCTSKTDNFNFVQQALTNPSGREYGFAVRKGGMPFLVDLKKNPKTRQPCLSITTCTNDLPRFTIPVRFKNFEAMYQAIGKTIDDAFRQGVLDPKLIRPHEYFTAEDDFTDCIELIDSFEDMPEREHCERYDITRRDVGDVRLTLSARRDDDNHYELQLSFAIMGDPAKPEGKGICRRMNLNLPEEICLCTNSSEMRDSLNTFLTTLARGDKDGVLARALLSTDYRWMQHELNEGKISQDLDAYYTADGESRYTDDMTIREAKQFCHVLADAFLKEQPSKTLWIDRSWRGISPEEELPLTDYQILGVSAKTDYLCPAFDARLSNGTELVLYPDDFIPSQMKALGCRYTEKEYGIPTELIPRPLAERGIFGIVPAIHREDRIEQARPVLETELEELTTKLCKDFRLSPEDVTELVRETVPDRQKHAKDPTGR
ncbi:hypothetical protein ACTNCI_09605 [Mitsuokella jalaludinii]|uniref:hypothetical protein n=1 Tax=Mitsuokella jalaludinii TaxID=187979 RepID=UPI003F8BDFE7